MKQIKKYINIQIVLKRKYSSLADSCSYGYEYDKHPNSELKNKYRVELLRMHLVVTDPLDYENYIRDFLIEAKTYINSLNIDVDCKIVNNSIK